MELSLGTSSMLAKAPPVNSATGSFCPWRACMDGQSTSVPTDPGCSIQVFFRCLQSSDFSKQFHFSLLWMTPLPCRPLEPKTASEPQRISGRALEEGLCSPWRCCSSWPSTLPDPFLRKTVSVWRNPKFPSSQHPEDHQQSTSEESQDLEVGGFGELRKKNTRVVSHKFCPFSTLRLGPQYMPCFWVYESHMLKRNQYHPPTIIHLTEESNTHKTRTST